MEQLSLLTDVEQRCRQCGEVQPLEAFHWADRAKGERQKMCRECFRIYNRARYLAKREEILAQCRAYHMANREIVSAQKRAKYWRDVEKSRAAGRANATVQNAKPERKAAKRAWEQTARAADPEKWRELSRRKYRENPDYYKAIQWRRRAQKLAAMAGPVTIALLAAKLEFWAGRCWLCGGEAVEWDHVKPLTKGGAHMLCNLRPACRACNAQKNARWPLV